ncbi:MAG: hypothetical protein CMQ05_00590 [Gammaproteobacteria bacterium]|nr:hypothetical protein [Gammaproteobacteria bacterium]
MLASLRLHVILVNLLGCSFSGVRFRTDSSATAEKQSSIVKVCLWILIITVLLFWLPLIGPLVAGFVVGKRAGGIGAGIRAAILPAILVGSLMFALATMLTGIPVLGVVAGMGGLALAFSLVGPLLLGAVIGGVFA